MKKSPCIVCSMATGLRVAEGIWPKLNCEITSKPPTSSNSGLIHTWYLSCCWLWHHFQLKIRKLKNTLITIYKIIYTNCQQAEIFDTGTARGAFDKYHQLLLLEYAVPALIFTKKVVARRSLIKTSCCCSKHRSHGLSAESTKSNKPQKGQILEVRVPKTSCRVYF